MHVLIQLKVNRQYALQKASFMQLLVLTATSGIVARLGGPLQLAAGSTCMPLTIDQSMKVPLVFIINENIHILHRQLTGRLWVGVATFEESA